MFLGEYSHTIDDKGRLTIPSKFRGAMAAGLVVTRGFDRSLMLYPLEEWTEMAERLINKPISDSTVRTFRRRLFSGAIDLSPDNFGRIVIPPYLREFAGIDSEVVVAGMYDYVEVWSIDSWNEMRETIEQSSDTAIWADLGI